MVEHDPAFSRWDEDLKARGLNPGTSADLCVAVALAAALADPRPAPDPTPRFYRVDPARNM